MDKRATTLELFFDLVFVFAITEVARLVHDDLTFQGFARGAIVMAMLWWGWTQFTWAANAIDLTPRRVRAVILVAMGVALIMAQAVPAAFEDGGLWLATGYAALRGLGLWQFWVGTGDDSGTRRALLPFIRWSSLGPAVMIFGAFFDTPERSVIWVIGIGLEILAAARAGRGPWTINAGHFAERHGLIVIIALGETIVAVGLGASDRLPSFEVAAVLLIALAGSCVLWWAYFDWLAELWEGELKLVPPNQAGSYARDVYSFLHYPMISGIVLYALAAEEMVAHPDEALSDGAQFALGLALVLYLGGQVLATYRSSRRILWDRIAAAVELPIVIVLTGSLAAPWTIGIVMALFLSNLAVEHVGRRGRVPAAA